MAVYGPVLIVEDDANDAEVIQAAISSFGIKNELKIFHSAPDAYRYLMDTDDKPMVILCDVHMPVLDGLAFLKQIQANEYLRCKAIPFIFYTGLESQKLINDAFEIGIQGYYVKAHHFEKIKEQLYGILAYWNNSCHPVPKRDAAE